MGCYTSRVEPVKRIGRVIEEDRWPDAAIEDMRYWLSRPPEDRVAFGRDLLLSAWRRTHGSPPPPMSRAGRIFKPEP